MPKIMFITTKTDKSMEVKLNEIKDYLLHEQGYDEEEIKKISIAEMCNLYEMYHED